MPHPDQHNPAPLPRRPTLAFVAPAEPTNADVLRAVAALDAKIDQLMASATPRRSSLTINPDEIARTMAQLKQARPIAKETPP